MTTVHVTVELEEKIRKEIQLCEEPTDTEEVINEDYREGYVDALAWVLKQANVKEVL